MLLVKLILFCQLTYLSLSRSLGAFFYWEMGPCYEYLVRTSKKYIKNIGLKTNYGVIYICSIPFFESFPFMNGVSHLWIFFSEFLDLLKIEKIFIKFSRSPFNVTQLWAKFSLENNKNAWFARFKSFNHIFICFWKCNPA